MVYNLEGDLSSLFKEKYNIIMIRLTSSHNYYHIFTKLKRKGSDLNWIDMKSSNTSIDAFDWVFWSRVLGHAARKYFVKLPQTSRLLQTIHTFRRMVVFFASILLLPLEIMGLRYAPSCEVITLLTQLSGCPKLFSTNHLKLFCVENACFLFEYKNTLNLWSETDKEGIWWWGKIISFFSSP